MENAPIAESKSKTAQKEAGFFIPVRIALYDNMRSIPRVIDSKYENIADFINDTSQKTYNLSHEMGGKIPYTIIREIIENLIHAEFKEIAISIMSEGNHIMVSDQGPGIDDKEKAMLPGYTSATSTMKQYIRGVGSGLPIVKETITFSGGIIDISDNMRQGTVISLKIGSPGQDGFSSLEDAAIPEGPRLSPEEIEKKLSIEGFEKLNNEILTERQKKILFLILELEEAGPSTIGQELGFSLSTSYRELMLLEKNKLLSSDSSGKRKLSKKGLKYLEYYSNNI
ncbi:MAG: ATP-binding protein [Actinobacteria bacterium]|nr:ATP-binding protein [Actinomycetota bacterium]